MTALQIEDGRERSLGLLDEEWAAKWDQYGWRGRLAVSLIEIVYSADASAEDRLAALDLLVVGVKNNLLPGVPLLADLICYVLITTAQGGFQVPWYRRLGLARRRAAIAGRVAGARTLLHTAAQWCLKPAYVAALPPGMVS